MHQQDDKVSLLTVTGPLEDPLSLRSHGNPCETDAANVAFVEDLQKSWVYRRNNALSSSGFSLPSTDAQSTTWTCLSGLSLAEISNISVINLVVNRNEVYNRERLPSDLENATTAVVKLPPYYKKLFTPLVGPPAPPAYLKTGSYHYCRNRSCSEVSQNSKVSLQVRFVFCTGTCSHLERGMKDVKSGT